MQIESPRPDDRTIISAMEAYADACSADIDADLNARVDAGARYDALKSRFETARAAADRYEDIAYGRAFNAARKAGKRR